MLQARSRELLSKFLFDVIDTSGNFETSKFQKASGLEKSVGMGEYAEGGAYANMKEPARISVGNLTLERGVNSNEDFYNWCQDVCDLLDHAPEGAGVLTEDLLRTLDVNQKDRTQALRIIWPMYGCFPARWNPSDWDNTVDDVQIEELELAMWWFDRQLIR